MTFRSRCLDDTVHVDIDEVEAGRRSPVSKQARFDMFGAQWLCQEGIGEQVDLADGQVVGRPPVLIDLIELVFGQWAGPKRTVARCLS